MVNNKVKTIAELTGLDIPQFRKQMIKILDDCNIKKRPDNNLSDIDWVKEFEIMTAGNYVKWKKTYQTTLVALKGNYGNFQKFREIYKSYESKYGK